MHVHFKDSTYSFSEYRFSSLTFNSYLFDWIFYVALLTTFMIYGTLAPPIYHEFLLDDSDLMYTYKAEFETVIPIWLLILIGYGFPIIQFLACSILSRATLSLSRQLWDIHCGLLALTGGMACQLMVTCILKNICGLPRPDLLSRCDPTTDEIEEPFTLATIDICGTNNLNILREGFRTFPSGHLSTVFCGMVISSLNIAGKLQVFDKRGLSFKVVVAIFPLMVACFVSCTRISDNRHFLRDVVAGSLVGLFIGTWFYLQYFPSIFNLQNGGRAFPPRRLGVAKFFNNVGGFWKIQDKLPGAYEERILNDLKLLPIVSQLGTNVGDQDILDISRNINIFNSISEKIKQSYININEGVGSV